MMRRRVALVAVVLLVLNGCGSAEPATVGGSTGTQTSATPAGSEGRLTFTRPDGSTFSLAPGTVRCGPSNHDPDRRAIVVESLVPPKSGGTDTNFFTLEAMIDDVSPGVTFTLPHTYLYDDAHGVLMFAADLKTENELSSDQEEASGTIVVKRASCEPRAEIEVAVDAVLGSEVNIEAVTVKGSFTAP